MSFVKGEGHKIIDFMTDLALSGKEIEDVESTSDQVMEFVRRAIELDGDNKGSDSIVSQISRYILISGNEDFFRSVMGRYADEGLTGQIYEKDTMFGELYWIFGREGLAEWFFYEICNRPFEHMIDLTAHFFFVERLFLALWKFVSKGNSVRTFVELVKFVKSDTRKLNIIVRTVCEEESDEFVAEALYAVLMDASADDYFIREKVIIMMCKYVERSGVEVTGLVELVMMYCIKHRMNDLMVYLFKSSHWMNVRDDAFEEIRVGKWRRLYFMHYIFENDSEHGWAKGTVREWVSFFREVVGEKDMDVYGGDEYEEILLPGDERAYVTDLMMRMGSRVFSSDDIDLYTQWMTGLRVSVDTKSSWWIELLDSGRDDSLFMEVVRCGLMEDDVLERIKRADLSIGSKEVKRFLQEGKEEGEEC